MEELNSFKSLEEFAEGTWKESTYEIVSKVAYLIGVPKNIFENEHEPPKYEEFVKLEFDKNARIIRHLCIIRTAIERNFKNINDKMRNSYYTIMSMPEYVPQESLKQLAADGINFIKKSSTFLNHHIIEINRIISDRLNNCKDLFPLWLNWQYIRDIIVMPNGLTEQGTKNAADRYFTDLPKYPYQMYLNWDLEEDAGNILFNDRKFVKLLYKIHNDYFGDDSMVSDAGSQVKGNVYDFINESKKVVLVVDCENSDPYNLCATLKNLDAQYTEKISKIILFDDIHTTTAWQILDNFTHISVERLLIERVKENKSLVDIRLASRVCMEHYRENVDSFILVSSDSDYRGLISSLPEARFLVMVEHSKCSPDMKQALIEKDIFYCYIDDFYSGNSEDLKMSALYKAMYGYIDENVHLNLHEMFDHALQLTRVAMSDSEKKQFYDKYLKTVRMEIEDDGKVVLQFKGK